MPTAAAKQKQKPTAASHPLEELRREGEAREGEGLVQAIGRSENGEKRFGEAEAEGSFCGAKDEEFGAVKSPKKAVIKTKRKAVSPAKPKQPKSIKSPAAKKVKKKKGNA
uniref:Uncharacterized protein n=1 Tax=Ananas comosus var. bracteatus TaxID=296719 RepID=A0A6V7PWU3_ANACO|nr:unnamed protein product [Ananas comosus var. bracteatus]